LRPGTEALVEVETPDGGRIGLLVLDPATARTAYRGEVFGAERLVLADGGVVFDRGEVRLHSAAESPSYAVFPAPDGEPGFARYALPAGEVFAGEATVNLVRAAGPAPEPVTGVQGRGSAPADKYFDADAAEYRVDLPSDVPPGTLLRVHWSGDVGRAYVGDRLVADQFFSGRVWDIGLDRVPQGVLRLRVLSGADGAAVYVPPQAGEGWRAAGVERVELVTTRRWTVR
jgi:hypothetical protein